MMRLIRWMKEAANQARFEMRQNKFLPNSAKLNDNLGTRYITASIATVCFIVLSLFLWSTMISIDETANADGEIVPEAKVNIVQHLEGGIVKKISVKNGDMVKKGQILMTLDDTAAASEYQQALTNELSILVELERLKSYLNGNDKDFKSIIKTIVKKKRFKRFKVRMVNHIYNEEKILLQTQRISRQDKRAVIQSQISKEEDHITHLIKQKTLLSQRVSLLREEESMFKKLRNKKVVSKREYLKILRDVNQAQQDILKLDGNIATSKRALEEFNNKLKQLNSELRETARIEMGNLTAQLMQIQEKLKKLEDKVTRHVVRSPINGIVKGIDILPGSVVGAGHNLLEVVPQHSDMIAEIQIKSRDIGHVKRGDIVSLKITTYDFARFGTLKGRLSTISATSFEDQDGEPYYKATVMLDAQTLKRGRDLYPLKSGMSVQANITTHSKTLFEYIVKPIQVSLDKGFHER